MPKPKTTYFQDGESKAINDSIPVEDFDQLVDDGYELIVIITPTKRYTASIDEWMDFGYLDLVDQDAEVRVLSRAYMGQS